MRRPIRPFTVERKRTGRPAPAGDAPVALDLPPPPPEPRDTRPAGAPRWAAAEALFSTPAPATTGAGSSAAETPARRILQSLVEPPAPVPTPDFDDAPRRRGRPAGSRNASPRARETQGPKTVETVMQNVFEFWTRESEREEAEGAVTPAPPPPIALRRRGRVARAELPRGQRWKARLPRFAR